MLTSNELAELIDGLASLPYGGEAVDQRRHALQAGAAFVRVTVSASEWPG